MISADVEILAKDSFSREIRNSRSFNLFDVRRDRSSQGKAYIFYMNCDVKFAYKEYQGGNGIFGGYNIGHFHDCLFIEYCNVSRRGFGTFS